MKFLDRSKQENHSDAITLLFNSFIRLVRFEKVTKMLEFIPVFIFFENLYCNEPILNKKNSIKFVCM